MDSLREEAREKYSKVKQSIFSRKEDFSDRISSEDVKRPFLAVLITGLIVVIGFMAFSGDSVNVAPETHVVELTDRGFDPREVVIDKGDTVRFVDNASITMWIASDPYPTNNGYSNTTRKEHCAENSTVEAFDQCSTGEVYEFTFEKSGEWGYHNQRPFDPGGRVVVK